jgi:hypothetical protein
MEKIKKIFKMSFKILIAVMVTILLAEIVFRIYNEIRPSMIFYDDSYNRFRGKPFGPDYKFRLNSRGFKDVEYAIKRDPEIYRIVGIGDSFTFGVVPYRYNYLTLLEKKLNQKTRQFEVINMGIPGTCPHDYLSILLREGLALKPDMVMLNFFMGNDFIDKPCPRPWYSCSYVATFVKYLFTLSKIRDGQLFHKRPVYRDYKPTLDNKTFLKIETDRSIIFRVDWRENFRQTLADTFESIEKMKKICDQREIQLLLVMIPDEVQINAHLQLRVKENVKEGEFDFTFPNRCLGQELAAHHIDHIDLLDIFKKVSATQRLYKPHDSHWNIAGNRLAANIIYRYINRKVPL